MEKKYKVVDVLRASDKLVNPKSLVGKMIRLNAAHSPVVVRDVTGGHDGVVGIMTDKKDTYYQPSFSLGYNVGWMKISEIEVVEEVVESVDAGANDDNEMPRLVARRDLLAADLAEINRQIGACEAKNKSIVKIGKQICEMFGFKPCVPGFSVAKIVYNVQQAKDMADKK